MLKWVVFIISITSISAQSNKKLNDIFDNALISDVKDNIYRINPFQIIETDEQNSRIKTNYLNLENLKNKEGKYEKWFLTQGEEASTLVEIKKLISVQVGSL